MKATNAIAKELYPHIEKALKSNTARYKSNIGKFMDARAKQIHEIAPFDRILFGEEDREDFFKSVNMSSSIATTAISHTYYNEIASFNPRCAKDEFTVSAMMCIRYFFLNKKRTELELSAIYLAFSGKFYPSIHSTFFPQVTPSEYRYIMEYVVNNELSQKFDLKREGSVFGAIRSICVTWLDTYKDQLGSDDDEDMVYLIQQLHDRIKSFMKNIATVYYEVYEKKDKYFTYDSDNTSEDNYRQVDNDSLRTERYVENAMSYVRTNSVNYKLCKMASDSNVRTDELKSIIESIQSDNTNIPLIRELMQLVITDYMLNSKERDINSYEFITKSIAAKPNAKDKNIIRQKEIIENWLNENSPQYRKRKSREATKNSYFKSILTYYVLIINAANK